MPATSPVREAFRLGVGAARRNLLPGSVLWVFGIALVVLYYRSETVAGWLNVIGEIKVAHSPWIGMLSTAIFGSVIPWLAQLAFLPPEKRQPLRRLPGFFLFWALQGYQVDVLYRLQDSWFGAGRNFMTIFQKMVVDEFIWVPFLAVPQIVMAYLFIENDASPARFRAALQRRSFLQRGIPLMIANWAVWIPTCSMVYLFPLPLQLPLMNIVLGMWCLIILFFSEDESDETKS